MCAAELTNHVMFKHQQYLYKKKMIKIREDWTQLPSN